MQRVGTTSPAAASTSYCQHVWLGASSQRLGDRRNIGSGYTSFSGATISQQAPRYAQQRRESLQIRSALFDPPPFDPSKLNIRYLPGTSASDASVPKRRQYTLTHNDLTGSLELSVGLEYNQEQLSGWYTRIVRDEVLAEWDVMPSNSSNSGAPSEAVLNVYCHVSGEEFWPAPPALRSFIFQREMRLVLDTIAYAERDLLAQHPFLGSATVYLHLLSDMTSLNKVVRWGRLGDRTTWQKAGAGKGLLAEVLSGMSGVIAMRSIEDEDEEDGLEEEFSAAAQQQQQLEAELDYLEEPNAGSSGSARASSSAQNAISASGARELERRTPSLASRARSALPAAMRRSPLTALPSSGPTPGRPGSKMVAVAAQRGDSMWDLSAAGGTEASARPLAASDAAVENDIAARKQ